MTVPRPYRTGQLARVLGDSQGWGHYFDAGTVVTLRTFIYNDGPGWDCVDPLGAGDWIVGEEDLELVESRRIVENPDVPDGWGVAIGPGVLSRPVSETGGAKDRKLADFAAIPQYPLRLLAERYGLGAQKYGPAPSGLDNWRAGYAWSLSYSALQRHLAAFWSGEDIDEETSQPHLVAVLWHTMALLEWSRHPDLVESYDDRQDPKTGSPH